MSTNKPTKATSTKSNRLVQKAITLLKDPKVQQAIITAVPVVIGLLKSRKSTKKK